MIGIFMNQIMQGKKLTIFGDGTQTRAFSYIDDVAIPIARSVLTKASYNQVFNIGADQPYSVNQLAEVVCDEFGVSPAINYLSARTKYCMRIRITPGRTTFLERIRSDAE